MIPFRQARFSDAGPMRAPAASFAAAASPAEQLSGEVAGQWHLAKLGGIETVWRDYTGAGNRVGIYDSGVEASHWDLAANYDAGLHVKVGDYVYDGYDRPWTQPHGTSVAGLIAAARNGVGTTGVAYGSTIASVNIFDRWSGEDKAPGVQLGSDDFLAAMEHAAVFDVVNHSWGLSNPDNDFRATRTTPGTYIYELVRTYAHAAANGRDGLGTISVGAAGNSRIDGQYDGTKTDRHIISVAAYREVDGYASSYSNRGASLLISAPSDDFPQLGGTGIVTTDMIGRYGYNTQDDPGGLKDHTDDFGGTSAASPIVAGVVSLMLEANAGLGWRDVSNILAHSATMPIDFASGPSSVTAPDGRQIRLNESSFAIGGVGANSNGGGLHYSTDYGYGAVNALAAVRMAEVWTLFGPARTSANEVSASTGLVEAGVRVATPDGWFSDDEIAARAHNGFLGEPTTIRFDLDDVIDIEAVDLRLSLSNYADDPEEGRSNYSPNNWKIKLTSPDGIEMFVDMLGSDLSGGAEIMDLTFGFQGFRGAQSSGTWTAQFEQPTPWLTGILHSLQLDLFGGAVSEDDVYHYTDEFLTVVAIEGEGARRYLADAEGVADWINAAAVTRDVSLSLLAGASTWFGGDLAFTIGRDTSIEHATTGDGDDTLVGNALDNRLYGMRGNDALYGGAGDDELYGGQGDDWLDGGAGDDRLSGGEGADAFVFDNRGATGADTIVDFDDRDTILLTAALADPDGTGLIRLGEGGILNLRAGSATDRVTVQGVTMLHYDGEQQHDGVTYHAYSMVGDPAPRDEGGVAVPPPVYTPGSRPGAGRDVGRTALDPSAAFAVSLGLPGRQGASVAGGAEAAGLAAAAMAATAGDQAEGAGQWHLDRIGNIRKVWEDYSGKSVKVGIFDSGVQYEHGELAANYDASLHITLEGKVFDGGYRPAAEPNGGHGTSVAGLIAAARDGVGQVGVAYDATITGVNIFDPWSGGGRDPGIYIGAPDQTTNLRAIAAQRAFDVVNHSWGPADAVYTPNGDRSLRNSYVDQLVRAFTVGSDTGRGGLGTISVVAAGNNDFDVQGNPLATDRHVIAVAAYSEAFGYASSYSNRGAALLVSAPSSEEFLGGKGIVTTDLIGRYGANLTAAPWADVDHTDGFGGTSAAAPIVAGVVALMLDANPMLGWRDVSQIIAQSATLPVPFETGPVTLVHPDFGDTPVNESRFAVVGAAGLSNGGGLHYSTDYGYGAIDAFAATRMAEVWSLFGAPRVSANEVSASSGRIEPGALILGTPDPDGLHRGTLHRDFFGEPTSFAFEIAGGLEIEAVDLKMSFDYYNDAFSSITYQSLTNVRFKLISPDGVEMFVDTWDGGVVLYDPAVDGSQSVTFGFQGFRGAQSAGTWTLQVEVPDEIMKFALHSFEVELFGAPVSADDVHHYTDEFFAMAAVEGEDARRLLSDTNGGNDWINAAAVSGDVDLSLMEGAWARFDGRDAFAIGRGSLIENAVTGDGNDRLIGNALDNKLFGMRGDDWLNGGAGDDTLFGGQGNDVFAFDTAGVSGRDRVLDWSAGDRIATSKQLRGADQNGVLTVATSALLLLDGNARGDTAELVGQGGATLQALGRSDGYWWYGFLSEGDEDFVDGRVTELALGQVGRTAGDMGPAAGSVGTPASAAPAMQDAAFFLYNAMGDGMAMGVQTFA